MELRCAGEQRYQLIVSLITSQVLTCAEDNLPALRKTVTDRDAAVWQDDDLAVMLNFAGTFYKLETNPLGTIFDAREGDARWNGDWRVETSVGEKEWMIEASLTWQSVAWQPAPGLTFGVNFCRQEKPRNEVSYWIPGSINDGWNVGTAMLR